MALDAHHLPRRLIVAGSSPGGITNRPQPHPRVPHVMTWRVNDDVDFLFIFYPESKSAVACGRASIARIAAQSDRGPSVTAEAFFSQIKAISSWAGILSWAKDLRMPILVANGAQDVILPAYRSFVLSQQAADAKLILYPDAGQAFLFQEIEDLAAQIDLFPLTQTNLSVVLDNTRPPCRVHYGFNKANVLF